MKLNAILLGAAITSAMVSPESAYAADLTGTAGPISGLTYNATASSYRGTWLVRVDIANVAYYSGGGFCTGLPALSSFEVELLAAHQAAGLTITPRYQMGPQLGPNIYRCIVAWKAS
jgi:fluoride ion exporter CrcB/FEX